SRSTPGGPGGGAGSIGRAQASAARGDALFDELVARGADRRRAGRAAIAVEGRITAEFQGIGEKLGACRPTRRGAARVSDTLIGEVDGPRDVLRAPAGERVG